MLRANTELADIIRREIGAAGAISCARFIELALYHPTHGYYQQSAKQIGCQGDFYTSVSVGSLFGELLAFQFAEWLEPLSGSGFPEGRAALHLVEAGAHDGRLALDVLSWFQRWRPELLDQFEYWILEPSAARRKAQEDLLRPFEARVRWCRPWNEFPLMGVRGVIFSNELLDAFPVFRVGWDVAARAWFEWRVDWTGERFTWTRAMARSPEVSQELETPFWRMLPAGLLDLLPDGFTVEVGPAARAWWSEAAAHLAAGKLLTFDYGLEALEFLAPHRQQGTLRGYRQHHLAADPLERPGDQDLTAHVNFTTLQEAGEHQGLRTERVCSQSVFLTGIASQVFKVPSRFRSWTGRETGQFRTLTHPDHLGHSFRVLVQARDSAKSQAGS